ncbi:solute carrier family 23 protein [Streptomyces sp. NPDC059564]|uniref:solute carrier family 23 protein n=1 Tax=Streptomyces sp. NPDC059564 TaxID=3346865 RepID=UPI0036964F72
MGKVDFHHFSQAPLFTLPEPFALGAAQFEAPLIATVLVVTPVSMTESTASLIAVGTVVDRPVDDRVIACSLRAQGRGTALGGALGAFVSCAYAQGAGLAAISRIRSRYAVTLCGAIPVLMGLVPVLGSLVALVPLPVLGGAGVVFFGSITRRARIRVTDPREGKGYAARMTLRAMRGYETFTWGTTPQ